MLTRPPHLPGASLFERPVPSKESPIVIMTSACLAGTNCGVDGTTNGEHDQVHSLVFRPEVRCVRFCPEDFSFGTPRMTPDIHGGNGHDVLNGNARILAEDGTDWTEGSVKAACAMRDLAIKEKVELAILLDISASCGTTTIYEGFRLSENKTYQKGPGVAAAALINAGIPVISQRDDRSLLQLRAFLDGVEVTDSDAMDHWEKDWYQEYFKSPS